MSQEQLEHKQKIHDEEVAKLKEEVKKLTAPKVLLSAENPNPAASFPCSSRITPSPPHSRSFLPSFQLFPTSYPRSRSLQAPPKPKKRAGLSGIDLDEGPDAPPISQQLATALRENSTRVLDLVRMQPGLTLRTGTGMHVCPLQLCTVLNHLWLESCLLSVPAMGCR